MISIVHISQHIFVVNKNHWKPQPLFLTDFVDRSTQTDVCWSEQEFASTNLCFLTRWCTCKNTHNPKNVRPRIHFPISRHSPHTHADPHAALCWAGAALAGGGRRRFNSNKGSHGLARGRDCRGGMPNLIFPRVSLRVWTVRCIPKKPNHSHAIIYSSAHLNTVDNLLLPFMSLVRGKSFVVDVLFSDVYGSFFVFLKKIQTLSMSVRLLHCCNSLWGE